MFVHVPLEIFEADLAAGADGLVQLVHVVVNALVHGLHAAGDHHLALQLLALVLADQGFQLLDELRGFAVGDEFGRLDRVHQKLQLRQLKIPAPDIVVAVVAHLVGNDVHAEIPQLLKIQIKSFAVGVHAVGRQLRDDLGHGQRMQIVRLLRKNLQQIKHLQLLIVACAFFACHSVPPLIMQNIPMPQLYHAAHLPATAESEKWDS